MYLPNPTTHQTLSPLHRSSATSGMMSPLPTTVMDWRCSSCSDAHKAANDVRNSLSWDKCDDTGLFGSCCQHDIPLKLVNIEQSGEKLYYPVSILDNLIKAFPGRTFGVLYDIGCHLDAHLRKRNLLADSIRRLKFGTSVFHAYVRQWSCQLEYNPDITLAGGFRMARGWSVFGPSYQIWSGLFAVRHKSAACDQSHSSANTTEPNSKWVQMDLGAWSLRHLNQALDCRSDCQSRLDVLYQTPNQYTTGNYTRNFLEQQWTKEREHYGSRRDNEAEKALELGRLFTLEEDLWNAWSDIPTSREDALSCLRSIRKMMDQIQAQRERLGTSAMLCGIEERHCKAFLRMLYCKTKLRRKHLALLAEKRPLDQVRMGRASKLGKERLVKSLRKRAEKLQTVLTQYTKSQAAFVEAFPDRPAPPAPQYDELLQMPANNPFWNDGILSNHNEPWAVDQSTQAGMRDIARLARAEEEVRQIGREVRRSVRWAVHEHNRILTLMVGLRHDEDWVTPRIEAILADPILNSLVDEDQLGVIKAILHNTFIKHASLQLLW
ncbi:hypothetical protein MJO28_005320 [Puccinia striiformis f. sp. tritici]|uniref:Uncharacterized protein n=1 Tax=Puccinia striiformis f. sp. tritici TaxID=168172 RepID=A0ACC0EKJ7_9BASI|nr:hypothetical protein MJO28_005320 [Puccinia striiformis f. sp. tritici]